MNENDANMEEQRTRKHSAKMNPSDVKDLQKAHGKSVSRYLDLCNVAKKTVTGAFAISSRECFEKCREIVSNEVEERIKEKENDIAEKNRKCRHKPMGKKMKLYEEISKNANVSKKSFDGSPIATWVTVYFRMKKQKVYVKPPPPVLNFSYVIKKRSSVWYKGEQLYEMILKSKIGREANINSRACINDVASILTELLNKHRNYPYHAVLQKILNEKVHTESEEQLHVTVKQYQLFVYKIVSELIPKSLFGCNKNEKILRKALKAYYLAPYKAPVCLKKYIHSLDISRIQWLQKIKDTNTRLSVIAKVVKWFYEHFFMELFKAVFRERKDLYNEKRIMMSAEKWKNFERDYIHRQLSEGRLVKVDPDDDCKMKNVKSGKMRLHAKSTGVRPIYRLRFTGKQKNEVDIMRTLLQQLYLRNYYVMSDKKLHTTCLTYAESSNENANHKVNIVTCDVTDAFGSIIQNKLFDIVNEMLNELPYEKLPLVWYDILLPVRNNRLKFQSKQWFSCWPETLTGRIHSLVAINTAASDKALYVKKEHFLAKLGNYIFGQYIVYEKQKYQLRKGVIQGSPLSSILADIYYQHMTVQEFGIFMESGTLLRYVDDYIYMTHDEDSARKFLTAIKKNVPDYNCRFKKSKIQTNVSSRTCDKTEWVTYLGYKLNGDRMEICPDYDKREFQYLKCLKYVPRKNLMKRFIELFKNTTCMKLNHIVLDSRINSLTTLCRTAGNAAKIMAMRCAIIILKIFKDATEYRDDILAIIRIGLTRIEATFQKYLTASDRAKWQIFRRKIRIVMWQSYFRVFARYSQLRELFCKKIKIITQNHTVTG